MEILQLLVSGISQGCVYGLIALGFVLIYKATEMVNFAQGDLMMLGAFFAWTFLNVLDLHFLVALPATILALALIGALTERVLIRPMIGEPHFSVLMLTIGLGFILRAVAGAVWGNEPRSLNLPYAGRVIDLNGLVIGMRTWSLSPGHRHLVHPAVPVLSLHAPGHRHAGVLPEPARRLLCGHSGEENLRAGVGHLRRHIGHRWHTGGAGFADRSADRVHRHQGFRRRHRRRFRQPAGRHCRRAADRRGRAVCRALPAHRVFRCQRLHHPAADAAGPTRRAYSPPCNTRRCRRPCVSSRRPATTRTSSCSSTGGRCSGTACWA